MLHLEFQICKYLLKFCTISRYRYTLDELYPVMNALKLRAESYNEWASNVNEALEAKVNNKKSMYLYFFVLCYDYILSNVVISLLLSGCYLSHVSRNSTRFSDTYFPLNVHMTAA